MVAAASGYGGFEVSRGANPYPGRFFSGLDELGYVEYGPSWGEAGGLWDEPLMAVPVFNLKSYSY